MGNLAVNNSKFLDYLRTNEITYPLAISIDIVENCNYRCRHCYIKYSFQESSDFLTFEELDGLFQQMGEYGVASVNLTGGEPLLRKDIIDIIKSAKRNNLHCCLKTNGFFLNKGLIDTFKELGLDEVVLSVYGMNNEEYMSVTGYPAAIKENIFGKFEDNIQYLIYSKIQTELRYVLLRQNYKNYGIFVEWCKKIGLKKSQYDFIIDITPDNSSNEDTHDNGMDIIQQEEFLRNLYDIDENFLRAKYRDDYHYKKCLVAKQFNHIKCNGDVYPCPNFPIIAGNIRKQTFREIWEDSPVLNELRNLSENEFECSSCENKNNCYHPCIAAIYVWNRCDSYTTSNPSYCNYKMNFNSILEKIKREVDN